MATHYGYDINPADIAANSNAVLQTGDLNFNIEIKGIRIFRSWGSASKLNDELSAGRSVIAGVGGSYSRPNHFIVIKEKSGDSYIMNDPLYESAHDVPLTDHYSVSDIVRVDTISIN